MKTAGIHEARQNLAAIIRDAGKGAEVVITVRGRPTARVVAYDTPRMEATAVLAETQRSLDRTNQLLAEFQERIHGLED